MRLWSLHPRYLDVHGLTALWREGLLAQAVLRGQTRGYRRHPQLARFQDQPRPLAALQAYLRVVWAEADRRGYRFDAAKLPRAPRTPPPTIPVTRGQVQFEREHLAAKLARRDPDRLRDLPGPRTPAAALHPGFHLRPGPIEPWERPAPAPRFPATRARTARLPPVK